MKLLHSKQIGAFGGANFIFNYFDQLGLEDILAEHLPKLGMQCTYGWKDIFYSINSIFYCGGDCMEDLHYLRGHFEGNPYFKMPSPDTALRRMSQLADENQTCRTKRGTVDHTYNINTLLGRLNIEMLKKLRAFDGEVVLDYDNTIVFTEKKDSKMTYKRNYGYQPGICTINEDRILYIENRNGNSDAKSFQHETLERMFGLLAEQGVDMVDGFRADSASYQYDVIREVQKHCRNFYIGCKNDYVEKYFSQITEWEEFIDSTGARVELGEIMITPFEKRYKKDGLEPQQLRMVVKRKPNNSGQGNLFTEDAYEYRGILTDDCFLSKIDVELKYNRRGNMEKQMDIGKNDFGWNNLPFSKLSENTVFMYIMAMCRNLYKSVIELFSEVFNGIKPTFRMKKFLFRFVILPSKWVKRSRQLQLRVFGQIHFKT